MSTSVANALLVKPSQTFQAMLPVAKYHKRYGFASLRNYDMAVIHLAKPPNPANQPHQPDQPNHPNGIDLAKLSPHDTHDPHYSHVWLHRIESRQPFKLHIYPHIEFNSCQQGDIHVLDESLPLFLAKHYDKIVVFGSDSITLTVEQIPKSFGWPELALACNTDPLDPQHQVFWTSRTGNRLVHQPVKPACLCLAYTKFTNLDQYRMLEFVPVLTKQNFQMVNIGTKLTDLKTAGLATALKFHNGYYGTLMWFVIDRMHKLTSLAQHAKTRVVLNEHNQPDFCARLSDAVVHDAVLGAWSSHAFQLVVAGHTIDSSVVGHQHRINQHYCVSHPHPRGPHHPHHPHQIIVRASHSVDVLVETLASTNTPSMPAVMDVINNTMSCQEGCFVRPEYVGSIPAWMVSQIRPDLLRGTVITNQ
jgi:hypothetical protein